MSRRDILVTVAVVLALEASLSVARHVVSGPDAWAHLGRAAGCEAYENRFTGRLRLDCPRLGGRHA
jgi:hypothetical protein